MEWRVAAERDAAPVEGAEAASVTQPDDEGGPATAEGAEAAGAAASVEGAEAAGAAEGASVGRAARPARPGAAIWWMLALLWFAGVAAGWLWFFAARAEDQHAAAARDAWMKTVAEVAAVQRRETTQTVEPARLMADVEALAFERYTLEQRRQARAHIAHRLTAMGYTPDLHGYPTGVNVLAERPGTDPTAKAILVAAHFDTVQGSPGADDNASGVAVVLEVARRLRERPTRRTLLLAFFDEEEQGLIGSRQYAASPLRIEALAGVVVVEMAGYTCKAKGCQKLPPGLPAGIAPDTGDFIAVIGDAEHLDLLAAFRRASGPANGAGGRPPVFALPVPDKGDVLPDTRRSDHSPFWDRGVGAVMVTDTAELRNPHYHRASDTPATLDPAFLAGVAAIVVDAVLILLEE